MWKICFFLLLIEPAGCILLGSVSADTCSSISLPPPDAFTPSLYRAVAEEKKNENLFLSPFSIAIVLSMVYLGAGGNTAKQLEDTLKISSLKQKIHPTNRKYLNLLQSESENFILKSANRIYANQKLTIYEGYKFQLTSSYLSTIESVDFDRKAAKTRDAINKWVWQYTRGKIQNIVPANAFETNTLLVLINAIYFKGTWKEEFDKRSTKKRDFFLKSDQRVKIETMYKTDVFDYKNELDFECQILELPYKGKSLSMFVVLPNNIDGLGSLEKKLNPEFFQNLVQRKGFSKHTIHVYLPKFRLESQFELKDILSKMGLTDLFDEQKSDLSRLVRGGKAYVSTVIHKTFVEVNEEGTEAAAATMVTGMTFSSPHHQPVPVFKADHPFLFCIIDHRMMKVLFIGRLKDPQM